ncbi:TIGR03943 family putative permease subunit [Cohnella sp. 56]|uniref:TIGR03943 family putative permease subunit n=1 Tax=Cohnella sp. 56 TaxID=3113722 RepID=UPI0030E9E331
MPHSTDYRLIAHSLVRAVILAGIAFYIVHLHNIGHLQLYIAPRMAIYTKLAAAGLYLIAASLFYQALREWNGQHAHECDEQCSHAPAGPWHRHLAVYSMFVIPLAVFFLSPDTTIGSAMASQKGINLNSASALKSKAGAADAPAVQNTVLAPTASPDASGKAAASEPNREIPGQNPASDNSAATADSATDSAKSAASSDSADSELDKLFPHDSLMEPYAKYAFKLYRQPVIEVKEKSYIETLTTLDFFLDRFIGRKISLSGFVYRDKTIGDGRFVLGRFAVQCCTADALPYGIIVEYVDEKLYKNDDWMTITGTLEKTVYAATGAEVMLLKADKSVKIKPAKDPYVYPDFDFGI